VDKGYERTYWLAWSQMPGIGPVLLSRLRKAFPSLETAWRASARELQKIEGLGPKTAEEIVVARRALHPQRLWEEHCQENASFWLPLDDEYPKLLQEIPDSPSVLYVAGPWQQWDETKTVAIVGTREPTVYGQRWARRLAEGLGRAGFTVVSGLAQGIDAEVHEGCLAVGGRTIAVVGTGVDRVYPYQNQTLHRKIIQSGLVVSEYPKGTGPQRAHFPSRNRIIAGLCRATILIEGQVDSGALITLRQANEYGREVYALPGALDYKQSQGCHWAIAQGAQIVLGVNELVESLLALPVLDPVSPKKAKAGDRPPIAKQPPPPVETPAVVVPEVNPQQAKVLAAIGTEDAVSFDRLVATVGLPSGEILSLLLQLELAGAVLQLPGMYYRRLV